MIIIYVLIDIGIIEALCWGAFRDDTSTIIKMRELISQFKSNLEI